MIKTNHDIVWNDKNALLLYREESETFRNRTRLGDLGRTRHGTACRAMSPQIIQHPWRLGK